jgi:hypothetical protein
MFAYNYYYFGHVHNLIMITFNLYFGYWWMH